MKSCCSSCQVGKIAITLLPPREDKNVLTGYHEKQKKCFPHTTTRITSRPSPQRGFSQLLAPFVPSLCSPSQALFPSNLSSPTSSQAHGPEITLTKVLQVDCFDSSSKSSRVVQKPNNNALSTFRYASRPWLLSLLCLARSLFFPFRLELRSLAFHLVKNSVQRT